MAIYYFLNTYGQNTKNKATYNRATLMSLLTVLITLLCIKKATNKSKHQIISCKFENDEFIKKTVVRILTFTLIRNKLKD